MNFSGEARKHEVKEFDTDSSEGSRALKDDFSRVIGEKKKREIHFKTNKSAFFKTPFQKRRKLMQSHKCPNEFCLLF